MKTFDSKQWALILGGSSGFGLATAHKLAEQGLSVCVVHRDRRGSMTRIEQEFEKIRATGSGFLALNLDALSLEGLTAVLDTLRGKLGADGKVRVLLHSIAFGNLKPLVPPRGSNPGETAVTKLAARLGIEASALADSIRHVFGEGESALHTLVPGPGSGDDHGFSNVFRDDDSLRRRRAAHRGASGRF